MFDDMNIMGTEVLWYDLKRSFNNCLSFAKIVKIGIALSNMIGLKVENSERDGNTRPPDLPLEKSVCRSGNNS